MNSKKLAAAMAAAISAASITASLPVSAEENDIVGVTYTVENGSIEFTDYKATMMRAYTVVSNQEYTMECQSKSAVFTPSEDGTYLVTVEDVNETIIHIGTADSGGHFHYFYPVLSSYLVKCSGGRIEIDFKGTDDLYNDEQIAELKKKNASEDEVFGCFDVEAEGADYLESGAYYSFVENTLSERSVIASRYCEFATATRSYFVSFSGNDIENRQPLSIDSKIKYDYHAPIELTDSTSDYVEIAEAKEDGSMSVKYHDGLGCELTVKSGVFHYTAYTSEEKTVGDANNDGTFNIADMVTLQKWLNGGIRLINNANADLCNDGRVDIYDLAEMRKQLVRAVVSQGKPMLFINCHGHGDVEQNSTYSVIDSLGMRYIKVMPGDTLFREDECISVCGNVMTTPNAKAVLYDDKLIKAINDFAANAQKYADCDMFMADGDEGDTDIEEIFVLYPDHSGNMKPLLIGAAGYGLGWLDDPEVQSFLKLLADHGCLKNGRYFTEPYDFEKPDNMPEIIGTDSKAEKQRIWLNLAQKYPDTDLSEFALVKNPDHPLGLKFNEDLYDVTYNGFTCIGAGKPDVKSSIYVTSGATVINLIADPEAYKNVDIYVRLNYNEVAAKYGFSPILDTFENVIYVKDSKTAPVLACRITSAKKNTVTIVDAATLEIIEEIAS